MKFGPKIISSILVLIYLICGITVLVKINICPGTDYDSLICGITVLVKINICPGTDYDSLVCLSMLPALGVLLHVAAWVLLVASLIGGLGICCELKRLIKLHTACLTLALVLSLTVTAESLLYSARRVGARLEKNVKTTMMEQYGYPKFQAVSDEIDYLQHKMKCCGYQSPVDWLQADYFVDQSPGVLVVKGNSLVPSSCCKAPAYCNTTTIGSDMFQTGCSGHLEALSNRLLTTLAAVSGGMAAIQVVGIVAMLHFLAHWPKKKGQSESHMAL